MKNMQLPNIKGRTKREDKPFNETSKPVTQNGQPAKLNAKKASNNPFPLNSDSVLKSLLFFEKIKKITYVTIKLSMTKPKVA